MCISNTQIPPLKLSKKTFVALQIIGTNTDIHATKKIINSKKKLDISLP